MSEPRIDAGLVD